MIVCLLIMYDRILTFGVKNTCDVRIQLLKTKKRPAKGGGENLAGLIVL